MAFEEEVFIVGLNWARGEEEALETSSGEFSTTPWYDAALDDRSAYDAALRGWVCLNSLYWKPWLFAMMRQPSCLMHVRG